MAGEQNINCPEDQRSHEGELLVPELWPEEEVSAVEAGLVGPDGKGTPGLSSYAAAAQLQQSPLSGRHGGIIPRTSWSIWPESAPRPEDVRRRPDGQYLVELPAVSFVLVSVDTAYSEREQADFSAVLTIGVWTRRREEVSRERPHFATRWGVTDLEEEAERLGEGGEQPRAILMEAFVTRDPLNMPPGPDGRPRGLVNRIIDCCRRRKSDRCIFENANRAQDTMREIQRQIGHHEIMMELFEPSLHGSKLNRMMSCQSLFNNGLVYAPANLVKTFDSNGREQVELTEFKWVEEVMTQAQRMSGKMDLADALSMGLIWLRTAGLLTLTPEFIKEELAHRAWKPKPFDVAKSYGVT